MNRSFMLYFVCFVFCRSFIIGDGESFEASKVCIGPVTGPDQTHVVYIVSVFLTLMFVWILRDTDHQRPSVPARDHQFL